MSEGSTYKVPLTTIKAIVPHNNAEKLEIASIYGFQVVVQKGRYQPGDRVIYVPVDSILPNTVERIVFPEGSKITLKNSRVKQIRLRGLASQGLVIDPKDMSSIVNTEYLSLEQDLKDILGITKYEPPVPGFAQTIGKDRQRNKKSDNPSFHKYNGLDNVKWFPDLFQEGEEVVIQCKLHGTNARAGIHAYQANTFWKRLKKRFGFAPKYENCYGSNNVEISANSSYKGFYGEDIYGAMFGKLDIFKKLQPGETVYGEIIGPGIQKNYTYGLNEHHFVVFDVKVLQPDGKQKWLKPEEVEAFAEERGLEYVPVLYKGPYNRELAYSLTKGPSAYAPCQKVREGIVIKSRNEYDVEGNKKALKWLSEEYLDKDQTDFH